MLEELFYRKNQKGNIKIDVIKPFDLTTEQITQTPRSFNASQIKAALENTRSTHSLDDDNLPKVLLEASDFLLKSFFLRFHQIGLYNRQLAFWKTLGTIHEINISNIEKGLFTKRSTDIWLLDLLTSSREGCITAVLFESTKIDIKSLRLMIEALIKLNKNVKLKGIIYILNNSKSFEDNFDDLIDTSDTVSKYESVIKKTKDIRFNAISMMKNNGAFSFEHIYPVVSRNND
ncbi:MAG: hypothetical protein HYR97_01500 [Candidatus Melainabacteria bacterium]|nr:hypothetical protein [Candidatus Melainabacteria bacterium]MBI3309012.1 hypothetical protein [Candidatus Melainabacteria bacterium]